MVQDNLFTSGQASGITGIHLKSIQHYVNVYRDCFSPGAAQPKKGRRFNHEDIGKLLLIRRMYFERATPENIRASLTGQPQTKTQEYTTLDIISLVEAARQHREAAAEAAKQAQRTHQSAQSTLSAIDHKLGKLKTMTVEQAEDIQRRLQAVEAGLQAVINKKPERPKGISLFSGINNDEYDDLVKQIQELKSLVYNQPPTQRKDDSL